jgi:ribosomal protein L37AE/L43A
MADPIYCPSCGDEMKHWNQGIYECEDCDIMLDGDCLPEYWEESE